MLNALTFDVEEYFQVEAFRHLVEPADWTRFPARAASCTLRLLDLLDLRSASATFFVVGWLAERHQDLVREIHGRGHELGCHGYAHRPIYGMTPAEFRDDLRRAKRAIEDAAGAPVHGFRAPTCSVVANTLWSLDVMAEEGFRYDSSVFPIHHDRYGIPDSRRFPHRIRLSGGGELVEFPMTTLRVAAMNLPFCGGGYLRLLPSRIVHAGLRRLNRRERMPAMVYLHPWEIDPDQPRMAVRGITRFRHYVNLASTERKLDALLREFDFAPAREVLTALGFAEVAA